MIRHHGAGVTVHRHLHEKAERRIRRQRTKLAARVLVATTAAASLAALASPGGAANPGTAYGGAAYAIGLSGVSVLEKPIPDEVLAATRTLGSGGGTVRRAPGTVTLPEGLGSLTVTRATVTGTGGRAGALDGVSHIELLTRLSAIRVRALCLPLLGCVSNLVSPGSGAVELLDIRSAESSATTNPRRQDARVGAISLLGQPIKIPHHPAPNTTLDLGLLSITLNRQSYSRSTGTTSVQALVLRFPPGGLLSPAITGTITIASSTASVTVPGPAQDPQRGTGPV